jgi:hypothetical protein
MLFVVLLPLATKSKVAYLPLPFHWQHRFFELCLNQVTVQVGSKWVVRCCDGDLA